MLKLCFKDYLAGRWLWLLGLALVLIYVLQAASFRSGLLMFVCTAIVFVWLMISDVIDDKHRTAALYASLPLTRAMIVRARYLLAAILTLAAAAFTFGMIALSRLLPSIGAPDKVWPRLLSLSGLAGFILASNFLAALYLPVAFKFGPGRAAVVFPALLAVAAAAVFGLERLITEVSHLASPIFGPGFWKDPAGKIAELLESAGKITGGWIPLVLALIISGAGLAGSSALAVRSYRRREF